MKKKIFGLIAVVLSVALMMVGCNNGNASAVSSVDDTQPVIIEEPSVEPESPEPSEEVVSEVVSEEKPAADETTGDPKLAALEVTEEFAKANELLCLYRKGKLYSLGPYVPAAATYDYQIGHTIDDYKSELMMLNPRVGEDTVATYGNAPEVVLADGDELRLYDGDFLGTLLSVEYMDYTISVIWTNKNVLVLPYFNDINHTIIKESYKDSIQICDNAGNQITDGNYDKMEQYTISWYEGIDYHEETLWADCREYSYAIDALAEVDYERTKEGYYLIKWTTLPSGCYMNDGRGFGVPFTVK